MVVKAWAERPESSDEEDDSESDEAVQRKQERETQKHKRGGNLWKRKTRDLLKKSPTVKPPLRESRSNPLSPPMQVAADESKPRSVKLVMLSAHRADVRNVSYRPSPLIGHVTQTLPF